MGWNITQDWISKVPGEKDCFSDDTNLTIVSSLSPPRHVSFSSDVRANITVFLLFGALIVLGISKLCGWFDFESKTRRKFHRNFPQIYKLQSYIPGLDAFLFLLKVKNYGCRAIDDWTKKLGKTFVLDAFFLRTYITADADIVQKILGSADFAYINKPKLFKIVFECIQLGGGVFALRDSEWANRRRLLSRSFSFKAIQTYLHTVNTNARKMVIELEKELRSFRDGSTLLCFYGDKEISDVQNLFTITVAQSVLMGAEILPEEENKKFREDFRRTKDLAVFRLFHPWCVSDSIFRLYPEGREFFEVLNSFQEFAQKLIRIYKSEYENLRSEQGADLVSEDLDIGLRPHRSLIEQMICSGFSDDEILYEVITFMIGGHETTVTTINSFMLMLALNPDAQLNCREEVDLLFARKSVESSDFDLGMEDISELKYMERCLQETLRLLPSIPIFNRGIEKPLKLDEPDLEIEAGSNVMINLWGLHRDPKYFPHPLRFDPDRFLPENVKARHKFAYVPFSANMRNCIAWKMAMTEIKLAMAWMLWHFEICTKEPLRFEEIKFLYELTIKPESDINFVLKRRNC